jgi:O-acetyl-ADP-ribose deacetylase (regulator of RNase III)
MTEAISVESGDLLDQQVEAIVNPWNCNVFPWWLLVPHGVSGAIRKRGGTQPFREVRRFGFLRPGSAVCTSAGRLPFRAIIHVAALDLLWRSSDVIVRKCVRSALGVAAIQAYSSVALPLIGSGVGGLSADGVEEVLSHEATRCPYSGRVVIVRYPEQPTLFSRRVAALPRK